MTHQRTFQLTCVDSLHNRHLREQTGNSARHAARILLDKFPDYWKVLSDKGNPVLVRNGISVPFPANGSMRAALEQAQKASEGASPEVKAEEPAPMATASTKPPSVMEQIRRVIVPHLHELPQEFTRVHVENLLRAHNAEHLITRASVNNVLNTWGMEEKPTLVKRATWPSGEMKSGYYEVLESVRESGRAIARSAPKSASAPPPMASFRETVMTTATGSRNASYANNHPALRHAEAATSPPTNGNGLNGHTNGHAEYDSHVISHASAASTVALTHEAPTPAFPSAAHVAAGKNLATKLNADAKGDLFTLLAGGVIGAAADDKAELEGAMDLIMQGYDRLTKIMERQASLAHMRQKVGELLQL